MSSKYSPSWQRNQARLRDIGAISGDLYFANIGNTGGSADLQGAIADRQAGGPSVFSDFLSTESALLAKNPAFDLQAATTVSPAPPENQSARPVNSFFSNAPAQSADANSNITNESSIFTPEKETITPNTQPLTVEEKLDIASGLEQQTLEDFSNLLSRLEASKMKQERKRAVEKRQDTMTKGLASMLGNF